MTEAALPGALRRASRERTRLLAAFGVALLSLMVSLVGNVASVTLSGSVNANWRGTYDILVRPPGAHLDVERTNGVIEPNFLEFDGAGGISAADVAAIRAIDGVELVAPIGLVGYMHYVSTAATIFTSRLPPEPTVYRLTASFASSDGIRSIPVARSQIEVVIGPFDLTKPDAPFATSGSGFDYGSDGVSFPGPQLPSIVSPLIAVDPVAERQLLGSSAAFLDPLVRVPTSSSGTVKAFSLDDVPAQFTSSRLFLKLLKSSGSPVTATRPVIPVVVSSRLYAPLRGTLTVEQIGNPLAAFPADGPGPARIAAAEALAGSTPTLIGSTTLDATDLLRPFQVPSLTLQWPGSNAPSGQQIATSVDPSFSADTARRPTYSLSSPGSGLAFEIEPLGPVRSDGQPIRNVASGGSDTTTYGQEQSYRSLVSHPLAIGRDFAPANPFDRPFVFAPIGDYDLGGLARPTNPNNYAPLGAYDPPAATLVTDGAGHTLQTGQAVSPTLNPVGLIEVPPLAISDLDGLALLRGNSSIDAVRVRVRGLTAYDPAGVHQVERVASSIASLGLDVDIVAGSSPQDVAIEVPSYDLSGPSPRALGRVTEPWTTLGAAERVETSLGGTNAWLIGLALLTAAAMAFGIEAVSISARRRDAAVFAALGWSRLRIVRWFLAEDAVGPVAAGLVLLVVWLAAGTSRAGDLAGLAVLSTIPAAGVIGAWLASRTALIEQGDVRPSSVARAVRPNGLIGYAARTILARPARSFGAALSIAIASAAIAIQIGVLGRAVAHAGPTHLAASLALELRPYQFGLIVLCAITDILLAVGLLRVDRRARLDEFRVLTSFGWSRRSVRGLVIRERIVLGLAGGIVAAPGAVSGAEVLGLGVPTTLLIVFIAAILLPVAPGLAERG